MAKEGCAKVASANVETVFSGAGRISMKSHCFGPQLLSDYAILTAMPTAGFPWLIGFTIGEQIWREAKSSIKCANSSTPCHT